MQELLKTQRISIAVLVIAFLLLIGLMVKKAPQTPYTMTAKEMNHTLLDFEHVTVAMAKNMKSDTNKYVFVDLRSPYDFEVKHIDNAVNIPTAFVLDEENRALFSQYFNNDKTVVLYGQSERESISPWMLLSQLGFANTKILLGGFDCYVSNNTNCMAEMAKYNYAKISTSGGMVKDTNVAPKPVEKKKVIPIKKKVKREAEGGC